MIIKELQLLSEALWESVKTDLKFFSSIQSFVRKFAEFDYLEINKEKINELILYSNQIEVFFSSYRSTDSLYFSPIQIVNNDKNVIRLKELVSQLNLLSADELLKEAESIKPKERQKSTGGGQIFIGHGKSKLWARVQVYLKDELGLDTVYYESESRTSESIINILDEFLDISSFAVIVMTAEDETAAEKIRARQNVIHEAGLFQGRLGFDKVIILKQAGVEEFSNISGLQYIPFSDDNIEQVFYEMQRKLKKTGLIKK